MSNQWLMQLYWTSRTNINKSYHYLWGVYHLSKLSQERRIWHILINNSNCWDSKFGHKLGGQLMAAWQSQIKKAYQLMMWQQTSQQLSLVDYINAVGSQCLQTNYRSNDLSTHVKSTEVWATLLLCSYSLNWFINELSTLHCVWQLNERIVITHKSPLLAESWNKFTEIGVNVEPWLMAENIWYMDR